MEWEPSIVTGAFTLMGTLGGALVSIYQTKVSAIIRLNKLYEPLIDILTPTPPYDDFHVDRELLEERVWDGYEFITYVLLYPSCCIAQKRDCRFGFII